MATNSLAFLLARGGAGGAAASAASAVAGQSRHHSVASAPKSLAGPAAWSGIVAAAAALQSRRRARGIHSSRVSMGGMLRMISKEEALPGRSSEMPIADKHFVLGTPMKGPWPEGSDMFVFANGCFWGSEKGVWRLPGGGVISTAVGYAAGFTPNPSYQEACSGLTGSTEAVQVVFDPEKIGLVDILRWFWQAHDPTQGMGQGQDGHNLKSLLHSRV